LSFGVPQIPVVFGSEPLDSLDKQLLEIISKHGREGQSFNKLVSEVSGFASRSTFALRVKRLERLNYTESIPDEANKQMRRIRGKPIMLLMMRITSRMKSQCSELEQAINSRTESIRTRKILSEAEIEDQKEFINGANEKIKGIYSLIGTYAVNFGVSVAGDLLLPMVLNDFKKLNSALGAFLVSNPRLMRALADEKLAGIPLDQLREDFRYSFGTELEKALPKFSGHLRKLAGTKRSS
jgi:DNA-binding Lrp family transcriptional regulator